MLGFLPDMLRKLIDVGVGIELRILGKDADDVLIILALIDHVQDADGANLQEGCRRNRRLHQ